MAIFAGKGPGRFWKGSGSHLPVLVRVLQATTGGVLELGTGFHSTPLLHWFCGEKKRMLISYEDNPDFFQLARKFQTSYHRIRMTDWNLNIDGHWSVALIDQVSKFRTPTALYLKDKVDYILLHDSEAIDHYRYYRLWPHFRYRWDYTKHHPFTTVISNFKDPSWLNLVY